MTESLLGVPNPFSDSAVGSVWDPGGIDVPRINSQVFDALTRIIAERARGHRHRSILLYGNPGSGKTHILKRLRLSLERDTTRTVPFAWVRMQTSPVMMWRHIRRTLADDLARRTFRASTQLQTLLETSPARLDQVDDRDLAVVLEHLFNRRYLRDARAWLAGNSLPSSALEAMGLAHAETEDEALEDESRRMVCALASFVAPAPLVLCLDQLEALQSHPGDKAGLFAIGKLIALLHDEAPNMVVIGSTQTGLIGELAQTLSEAERDRYQPQALRPLDAQEVRELVKARLDSAPELARVRPRNARDLWPIDVRRVETLAASREGVSARKVIFECEQMFREAQNLKPDTVPLDERLAEKYQDRAAGAARELSPDTSTSILSDGLTRLLHLLHVRAVRIDVPRWTDHVSVGPSGRRTAVVLANSEPRSLWRKLEKIEREWDPALQDLVIIRDALNPLKPTAARSRELLQTLQRRGARLLNPSREALIALDAARRLLADVESGDLTYRGDRIEVATVEDWVRNHLSEPVSRLLNDLVGDASGAGCDALRLALAEYLGERKVAPLRAAANDLNCDPRKLEECANQSPDQFGLLAGAEPVVFERIPTEQGA